MNSNTPPHRPFEPNEPTSTDPIKLFQQWLEEAEKTEPNDPNAMALATCTRDARPSVRMVLMKAIDDRGFTFYTNAHSQKGSELADNPHASANFHWKTQRRQVRLSGVVASLPPEDADRYFHSRSIGSQAAAAVSQQSQPLAAREQLEAAARLLVEQYPDGVPRPDHWHGYVLQPDSIEFWQDGKDRLHDRMLYTRTPDGWSRTRLYP